jgi:uncharacterized protein YggT (Ycf19 family)
LTRLTYEAMASREKHHLYIITIHYNYKIIAVILVAIKDYLAIDHPIRHVIVMLAKPAINAITTISAVIPMAPFSPIIYIIYTYVRAIQY